MLTRSYFPELSGEDGVGLLDPGIELLFRGIVLLPELESYPPGEVAPPVAEPGDIPKWE